MGGVHSRNFWIPCIVLSLISSLAFAGSPKSLSPVGYAPGELMVRFKTEVGAQALATTFVHQLTGARVVHQYKQIKGLQHIKLPTPDIRQALAYYQQHPMVEYAEPNYLVSINEDEFEAELPNDARFPELWGLLNTGQIDPEDREGVVGADIDATLAWGITQGDESVVVAIIDTGVDYTHEELKDRMWVNEGEIPGNDKDDDENGFVDDIYGYDFYNDDGDPIDDHNHGTHVAGTIAATGGNDIGVIGVAPQTRLMACKFLSEGGGGKISDAVLAVDYAVQMKAKVLNNSWGGGGFTQALNDAIALAAVNSVVFVAAAGNSSRNNDASAHYPSNYEQDNVIAVAATNNQDVLSDFSNYGFKAVDIAAPGEQILSTIRDNEYDYFSGTSMATPHVAGVVALLLATNPEMTPLEIRERLMNTSEEVVTIKRRISSGGRLNAYNALTNTVPAKGDPKGIENWVEVEREISTPHKYPSKMDEIWTITHEGATYLKVHFEKFDTEEDYDVLTITDAEGNLVDRVDGYMDSFWSFVVKGETLNIHFSSDYAINMYGFDINKYAFTTDVVDSTLVP